MELQDEDELEVLMCDPDANSRVEPGLKQEDRDALSCSISSRVPTYIPKYLPSM